MFVSALTVFGLLATTQVTSAAPKKSQTVKFSVTGDCKGEEEMIEGESEDNCKIVVTISSTSPSRSAVLELLNEDDEWDEAAKARSKSGKISFKIDATDEDDAWLDGDFTFRVVVAKSGSNKAATSKEYTFTFTPAEEEEEEDEEGSGEASSKQKGKSTGNTKLDTVLGKIDDKNNSFDDNCSKEFGAADCKLMFTSTGPNWAKLSASKWDTMCKQLLKQSSDNCKKMYGISAPPEGMGPGDQPTQGGSGSQPKQPTQGGSGSQPKQPTQGGPGSQPQQGGSGTQMPMPTEASIKAACTTAGIADCTEIVKVILDAAATKKMPDPQVMGRLLGAKQEAFSKAMGFAPPPSTKK